MGDWKGEERRHGNVTLYDVLLEVREVKNDLKHLVEVFNTHVKEDYNKFEQIIKDVKWTQGIAIAAVAIVGVFQFLISSGTIDIHSMFAPNGRISRPHDYGDYTVGNELRSGGKDSSA